MRTVSFSLLLLSASLLAQSNSAPATGIPILDATAPVITINGLCAANTPAADCKTVITKADFEKILEVAGPNMPTSMRRQAAEQYGHMLVRSRAAEAMDIENSPKFQQQMKVVRMQVLSSFLTRSLQEKAADISDADLQTYYDDNKSRYEQVTMERVYVPKTRVHAEKKPAPGKARQDDEPAPDAAKVAATDEAAMKAVAESLHERAVAGEKFDVLEKEAMAKTGSPGPPPNTAMGKMSRGQLPPQHASVFDLKSGELSPLISDASGFYFYRVLNKEFQPLDTVKTQIKSQLQSQRSQDALKKVDDSAKIQVNEAYFGPPTAPPQQMHGPGAKPMPAPHPTKPQP